MIAVIDYGAGNLRSVNTALAHIGAQAYTAAQADELLRADAAILPGVGAFGDAMAQLSARGLDEAVRAFAASGRPLLGICLGLQLFFERSEESPGVPGLGLLPGVVRRIPDGALKVPQIGWNCLHIEKRDGLLRGIRDGEYVYFVHSYYLEAANRADVSATTDYGVRVDAAVERDNLYAAQFHPEKSGEAGLLMLQNFARIAADVERRAATC